MRWPRFGRRPRRWSIVTSAPRGEAGERWGDTWFARDLAEGLRARGEEARVLPWADADSAGRDADDVVLVLRGLKPVVRRAGRAHWMLWIISHPELVTAEECEQYDAVFAASAHWSRATECRAMPLLQATNPSRFTPDAAPPDSGDPLLFVGSTRGEYRPIVRDALACGAELSVYGVGWEAYLPPERIRAEFLANEALPAAYAGAGIVLNDHWRDMAAEGFLSNRLFDAVASGARVVSDPAVGLADVFGVAVRTYREPGELCEIIRSPHDSAFGTRDQRAALAADIAREHSFDARARALLEHLERIR